MRAVQLVFALVLCSSALMAQTITTSEAAKHAGERETVCGMIAGEHTAAGSRGTPTFINLDRAIRTRYHWAPYRQNGKWRSQPSHRELRLPMAERLD